MRTTVEFPPALIRAAKARSAERGESLKSLLARAVAAELGGVSAASTVRLRVTLPLFGQAEGPPVNPSNADLERALAEADADRVVGTGRPRRERQAGRSRTR